MLAHGLDGVSMDAIADSAGASKATIYRWWPSKHHLALEALLVTWESITRLERETDSLRTDLVGIVRPWVRRVAGRPYARIIASLIAQSHNDPEFGEVWRERFVTIRRERGREAFERAIGRGEIAATTDVELALDLLFGALYHRLLHGHAPLNGRVAEQVVDAVLAGVPGWVASA